MYKIFLGLLAVCAMAVLLAIVIPADTNFTDPNSIIKVEKKDGILDFVCSCGSRVYAEDGEGIFWYRCAKCGTVYTNTDCKTINEFLADIY